MKIKCKISHESLSQPENNIEGYIIGFTTSICKDYAIVLIGDSLCSYRLDLVKVIDKEYLC